MIKSVGDKKTADFLAGKRVKEFEQLEKKLKIKLSNLNAADSLENVSYPSNRLHKLKGEFQGFWSISVNMQYRIIFRWDAEKGDAYDVTIIDYH